MPNLTAARLSASCSAFLMPVSLSAAPVPTPSRVTPLSVSATVTATKFPTCIMSRTACDQSEIGDRLPLDIIHEVHLPFAVAPAFALFDVSFVETATQSLQQLRKVISDVMMTIGKWRHFRLCGLLTIAVHNRASFL
jgi:hypothetical protein